MKQNRFHGQTLAFWAAGLFFLALCAGFFWLNAVTAPKAVPTALTVSVPEIKPYPELENIEIHIHSATPEELSQLPGIGPAKAQAIYEYVQENSPLLSLDELLNVKGIGEKTLAQISGYLILDSN